MDLMIMTSRWCVGFIAIAKLNVEVPWAASHGLRRLRYFFFLILFLLFRHQDTAYSFASIGNFFFCLSLSLVLDMDISICGRCFALMMMPPTQTEKAIRRGHLRHHATAVDCMMLLVEPEYHINDPLIDLLSAIISVMRFS